MPAMDSPKTFAFWRNLFLYFYVFSLLGHFLEVAYSAFRVLVFGSQPFVTLMPSMVPLSPPYGIGAIILVVLAAPILQPIRKRFNKLKHHWLTNILFILITFVVVTLLMAGVEIASGFFCIAIWGYNPFWHYSGPQAFFDGTVYLTNTLLFGLIGTFVLLAVIPPAQRFLARSKQRTLTIVFWVLLITYAADLTTTMLNLKV